MSDGVLNHRDLCALDIFLLVIPGKQTLSGLTLLWHSFALSIQVVEVAIHFFGMFF